MRAFNNSQINVFLNAFGETLETLSGTTFKAILEMVPVSISTGGGFVEGYETYATAKKADIEGEVSNGTVLIINGANYKVYNIVDDLSGMVDIYYRDSAAEDY